jgi:hypothetical protein
MPDTFLAQAGPVRAHGRGADKRVGLGHLLTKVTTAMASGRDVIRERFEEELRALVRARSIALRDEPDTPGPHVTCFDVPASGAHHRGRIEAVFEAGRRLDGWTCQVLEGATHVAALILEIERAGGRLSASARGRADGAAPLIGSSPGIRAVRDRIERVAATDFTVLIEGAIGPQPHPSFIEVFGPTAFGDRDGEVARKGRIASAPWITPQSGIIRSERALRTVSVAIIQSHLNASYCRRQTQELPDRVSHRSGRYGRGV